MSHIDQINFIREFRNYYLDENFSKDIHILEVGSLDVNGNMRDLFNFSKNYMGIDLIKGPNVDLVMDGAQIDSLKDKFDIVISCECFEHAKNWKTIFEKMCKISKDNSFVVISVASTGRIEHGTERSGNWQSPGNKDDYYLNLTENDFRKNFNLNKIFSNYFFFYNLNSFDLYFVGIKGYENKKDTIKLLRSKLKILFKKKKIRKVLIYLYSLIISEKLRQNIFFFKTKIKFRLLRILKKI